MGFPVQDILTAKTYDSNDITMIDYLWDKELDASARRNASLHWDGILGIESGDLSERLLEEKPEEDVDFTMYKYCDITLISGKVKRVVLSLDTADSWDASQHH